MNASPTNNKSQSKPSSTHFRSAFLHSVGLGIGNNWINWILGNRDEPRKPIVEASLWTAIARCGVHLLPCAVSIIIISINLRGYFIGFELAGVPGQTEVNMAMLQVAAKIQELLVVASLATIVAHKVRYDLISGNGVPFGLVGASSLFTQLSFFWSSTFLGPLTRMFKANMSLLFLVVVSGLIAVTAGPSVAVLIIPREQTWAAGGATYFINGTSSDLWPTRVGLEHYYKPQAGVDEWKARCTESDAWTNALCPAGGYLALLHRFSSEFNSRLFSSTRDSTYSLMDFFRSGQGVLIYSPLPSSEMQPYTMITSVRNIEALESSAIAVHGPSSWLAGQLGDMWYDAAHSVSQNKPQISRYRYYATMKSIVTAPVPAVRVVCTPPQPFSISTNINFPWVPDYERAFDVPSPGPMNIYEHGQDRGSRNLAVSISSLNATSPPQYPTVHRVDLSEQPWTNSTTGIVIDYPLTSDQPRSVSGCVVDARWVDGKVLREFSTATQPAVDSMQFPVTKENNLNDIFQPSPDGSWRRIDISEEVFDAVMFPGVYPVPSKEKSDNETRIDELTKSVNWDYKDWVLGNNVPRLEHMIAATLADALARVGAWRTSKVFAKDSRIEPDDWITAILTNGKAFHEPPGSDSLYTSMSMEQEITGYAFKSSTVTDYLSIAVLVAHLVMATGHTILMLSTRRSSACWDSFPELMALAIQSLPSQIALKNTAAGIFTSKAYAQNARILVAADDKEHVELSFDADREDQMLEMPDVLKEYG
ncbi:hypothetical protein PSPO01_16185 [Paraphaeosphaeria sporulosa]